MLPKEAGLSDFEWEQQLIEGCRRNERQAQFALYQRYARKMFGLVLRYAKNRQDAEDWLQEGFLIVFKEIKNFRGDGYLTAWIRKIMINTALQALRKETLFSETLEDNLQITSEELPFDDLALEDILLLLRQLPTGYRTVFNLYAIEGYSHAEIAQLLGISESTSKSQYSRAKEQLRQFYHLFFEKTVCKK
ncbi:MAG: sigma-70 family RNA polymerase sigma factor [Bacteroidia bacterium]|nr:sigma-70 family RNA polymerase sigma factor [Bacteroidia bacterium]